eukprot:jgi/Botrbrau1/23410/Bobra.0051s0054.1
MRGISRIPRLEDICIDYIAANIQQIPSLDGLPDIIVVAILEEVLRRGKLDERILDMVLAPGYELVNMCVKRWGIKRPPFVPPPTTGKRWLGEKPGYY